jgi:CheY-like chemotaxis protein
MSDPVTIPTRILLVDDDIEDCIFFREALLESGLNTTLKISNISTDILGLMEQETLPDLIFLDMNMPEMKGSECLREIRKTSYLDQTPVIIFSTSCVNHEVEETFATGANLYVQKPAGFKLLTIVLQHVINLDWQEYLRTPNRDKYVFNSR